jgi:hypothetical protein
MNDNAIISDTIRREYEANLARACATTSKMLMYDNTIAMYTQQIDKFMCAQEVDAVKARL